MFSIFESLARVSIRAKNLFSYVRINSPNIKVNYGKGNQYLELKPRSSGPYLLVRQGEFQTDADGRLRLHFGVINFGSEPANNVQTFTEIYVDGKLKTRSSGSPSSIVPPDTNLKLPVTTDDDKDLVELCTPNNPQYIYQFVVEYEDLDGNKYVTYKSLFFIPKEKIFSTREEKALKIPREN